MRKARNSDTPLEKQQRVQLPLVEDARSHWMFTVETEMPMDANDSTILPVAN